MTCPECGGRSSIASLYRPRPRGSTLNIPEGAATIAIGGIFPLWVIAIVAIRSLEDTGVLLLWPLVLSWGLVMRHRVGHRLVWSLGAAAGVGFVTAYMVLPPHRGTPSSTLLLLNGWPLAVWALMWNGPSRRDLGAMVLFFALIPATPAAAMVWSAASAYSGAHYWTNWDRSFVTRGHNAAMSRRAALEAGFVFAAMAAIAGGAGVVLRRPGEVSGVGA